MILFWIVEMALEITDLSHHQDAAKVNVFVKDSRGIAAQKREQRVLDQKGQKNPHPDAIATHPPTSGRGSRGFRRAFVPWDEF